MTNRLRAVATAMLSALVTLSASADSVAAQTRADTAQVELMYGIRVPMKDGVTLSATIYKPKNQVAPLPVIFWMTPYIADLSHARGMYFARNGYVFAVVDTRGRGSSGGTFEPFANEWSDGPELVRWFARQPWSNGKIGLWGGSYGGFYQWAIAKNRPAELVSMAPVASAHPGVDFPSCATFSAPMRFSGSPTPVAPHPRPISSATVRSGSRSTASDSCSTKRLPRSTPSSGTLPRIIRNGCSTQPRTRTGRP